MITTRPPDSEGRPTRELAAAPVMSHGLRSAPASPEMNRRTILRAIGATGLAALASSTAYADCKTGGRKLVLIRLKGGNDGLNTVIPYADPAYYQLRPTLAIRRDGVLQLDHRFGLHPALEPLVPLWRDGEMAILQGVGYPDLSLSHFRSSEIWDRAYGSLRRLPEGRCDVVTSPVARYAAGPNSVAGRQSAGPKLRSEFPNGDFGLSARAACLALASDRHIRTIYLDLDGFDTHENQASRHAALLSELAQGLRALRAGFTELGLWDSTLLLTQSEFGRRMAENPAAGTDHGTAAVHFALGGGVRGGFYGKSIDLARLDGNGNPEFGLDLRAICATVLERWMGMPAFDVLGRQFEIENFLRA